VEEELSRTIAIRFMKNSSRFDEKMARNFTRSSRGVRTSSASASTRRLNSIQLKSLSIQTSARDASSIAEGGASSPGVARAV